MQEKINKMIALSWITARHKYRCKSLNINS